MSPLLPILLLLLVSFPASADTPSESSTEYDKVQSLKGVLVIEGYSDLGGVKTDKGGRIDVRIREAAAGNQKAGAVEIYNVGNSVSIVGLEEVPPLLAAIDAILKLDKTASKLDDYDAIYRTCHDLVVERYTSPEGKLTFSIAGVEMSAKELADTRDLIAQAQAKLKALQ